MPISTAISKLRHSPRVQRRIALGIVTSLGLMVTLSMWSFAWETESQKIQGNFENQSKQVVNDIQRRLDEFELVIRSGASLLQSGDIDYDDWERFTQNIGIDTRLPGAHGIVCTTPLSDAQLDDFAQYMRQTSAPQFQYKELAPSHPTDPNDPAAHYIVTFISPRSRNSDVIGRDVAAFPGIIDTLRQAHQTGQFTVLAPTRVLRDGIEQARIILMLPTYKPDVDPAQHQGDQTHFIQHITALTFTPIIFMEATTLQTHHPLHLQWYASNQLTASNLLYDSQIAANITTPTDKLTQRYTQADCLTLETPNTISHTFTFGGQPFTFLTRSITPLHPTGIINRPNLILAVGLLTTFIVVTSIWSLIRTRDRAYTLADKMTASLRKSESQSRELATQAQEASVSKSIFLANMSHEIRTPMTAILGYIDMLDHHIEPDTKHDYLGIIRRNGQHLMQLLNDILDLSKIDAGKLIIESKPCNISQLVNDVTNLTRQRAESKGLKFTVKVDGKIPETISTDALRLKQILINLLGNAVKFTEHGRIDLQISYHASKRADQLIFKISDTGIGIKSGQVAKIFKPFTQADTSSTRHFGGTGLGLSISQHLAEMLGGQITCNTTLSKGSVFTCSIAAPLDDNTTWITQIQKQSQALKKQAQKPPTSLQLKANILIAEDGADNQQLLALLLTQAGASISIADNGRMALDAVLNSPHPFDLVLMDTHMPILDGYTATQAICQTHPKLPIIALATDLTEEQQQKCVDAGYKDILRKPLDKDQLIQCCHKWTQSSTLN